MSTLKTLCGPADIINILEEQTRIVKAALEFAFPLHRLDTNRNLL